MTDWRQLFVSSTSNSLEFYPPQLIDGVPTVSPPAEVYDEGIKEWQYSLVAQFLGKPPNFSLLHRVLSKLWEKKGLRGVSMLRSPLYLLQFESAAARDWVLENGPWHIQHNSMILRKWEPDLARLTFDLAKLPIWVHLHHVPLELFHKTGLGYLASYLGTPLYMDNVTASKKRLAYAKVCIEIEASKEVPDQIPVVLRDGTCSSVLVSVPWKPPNCKVCCVFGHNDDSCPKKDKIVQKWQPKPLVDPLVENGHQNAHSSSMELPSTSEKVDVPAIDTEVGTKGKEIMVSSPQDSDGFLLVSRKGSSGKRPSLNHSKSANSVLPLKKSTQIAGSSNIFLSLCDGPGEDSHDVDESGLEQSSVPNENEPPSSESGNVWLQLVEKAVPRKKRAAAKGAARVLQDMKSRKAKTLAKVAKQIG